MESTLSDSSSSDADERPSFGSNSFSDFTKISFDNSSDKDNSPQALAPGERRRDDDDDESANEVSHFAKKRRSNVGLAIMEKFGWGEGRGLGKDEQGRKEPVQAFHQKGRRGLGHDNKQLAAARLRWDPEQEEVSVREEMSWISSQDEEPPTAEDLQDWLVQGPRKETISDETLFCHPDILKNVLNSKTIFDSLDNHELRRARTRSNPYETIRGAFFLNRAAVKMANMDKACDFMFTKAAGDDTLYFADVCAGPGGFSEYVLWRKKWHAKGFGFTLRDSNDFKLDDFYAGSPETFHPFYGPKEDGNVYDPVNQKAFQRLIMEHTKGHGVHFMMADGGFSVEGKENIQEILSKQLYLCQCLVALMIVRERGHFVTKLFDLFTPFSVGLVYLLYRCFENVSIFKPNTSRPANSERYLICQNKKSNIDDVISYLAEANDLLLRNSGQDVTELVPLELLQDDDKFYEYIFNSNNSLGSKQIVGLLKIAAYCEDTTLFEHRQPQMRKECLEYWDLPDQSRIVPKHTKPEEKLQKIVRATTLKVFKNLPGILTNENLSSTILNTPCDWYCVLCGASADNDKAKNMSFYLGMGRTKVFKFIDERWERVPNVELPPDTLIYAELVNEMRGQHRMIMKSSALHIIDAYLLGGEDVSEKPIAERHTLINKFCQALWKPEYGSHIPVRPKELFAVDQNLRAKLQLPICTLKNGQQSVVYYADESQCPRRDRNEREVPFIIPNTVLFLKNISLPWQKHLSKTTGYHYYFNTRTGDKFYDDQKPASANACFAETIDRRMEWHWLADQSLTIDYLDQSIKIKCPGTNHRR